MKFNADTLLASLDRGTADVFVNAPAADKEFSYILNSDPPPWHQAEYVRIATAAFQYIWGETPREWNLYRMTFDTRCASVGSGFAVADFVFFRPVWIHGTLHYTGRQIWMLPLDNVITWGGGANYPHPVLGWKSIDLEHLKISADEALRIAELNGGQTGRLGAGNGCLIHLTLLPDAYGGEWSVMYTSTANKTLLDLNVNTKTGEVSK